MPNQKTNTVRRSVALPRELVDEMLAVAPPELKGNVNRMVLVSLRDFVARRRAEAFARAMAEMAADQDVRSECAAIAAEFAPAELDGLRHD
jgi:hypothetical protein